MRLRFVCCCRCLLSVCHRPRKNQHVILLAWGGGPHRHRTSRVLGYGVLVLWFYSTVGAYNLIYLPYWRNPPDSPAANQVLGCQAEAAQPANCRFSGAMGIVPAAHLEM